MHAAVIEVGVERHICAVKFLTRDAADQWVEKNDAEIVAWAPLISLGEARALGGYSTAVRS